MMMILKSIITGCLTVLMASSVVFSQSAYYGYAEEPVNPAATGMGGAGTAGCSGGFSFYNPACIAGIDPSVAFEYGQQWNDISRGRVETAWSFPKYFLGASVQTQSNTFSITDETGSGILSDDGSEQASIISLLFGYHADRYAVGAGVNTFTHRIHDEKSFALSACGGITASILPGRLSAGMSIINAGRFHRGFDDSGFEFHDDSMPTIGRAGVSWNDTIIGKMPITILVDAVYSMNYGTMSVPVGFELKPLPPLAVRMGKRFNHPTDVFSFGLGIVWENIAFDAALTPSNVQGDMLLKWIMGLRYSLPAKRETPRGKTASSESVPTTGIKDVSAPPVSPVGNTADVSTEDSVPSVDSVNVQTSGAVSAKDDSAVSDSTSGASQAGSEAALLPQSESVSDSSADAFEKAPHATSEDTVISTPDTTATGAAEEKVTGP